jgi:MPBQ/MSBQ methyltransferase
MRLIQHKKEAYWFYRCLSLVYDRWVNPLFWTLRMRAQALELARLDDPSLTVLDAGAGTGFTTAGIVERVPARQVTMLDQSPHQLARARAKPALADCPKLQGDAERLPFPADFFDRYVSAGSIEYWPDPQRGVAEAYRVTKPGGTALVIGPVRPTNRLVGWLAQAWMLFPAADEYAAWMTNAGFSEVEARAIAPDWYRDRRGPYALAVSGTKPAPGPSPLRLAAAPAEDLHARLTLPERLRVAARFVAGAAAGAVFVPIGAALALRARVRGDAAAAPAYRGRG